MSRIQDILSKAEREGTARRTRALNDDYAARPTDEDRQARGFVDVPPPPRLPSDPARIPVPPGAARGIPESGRDVAPAASRVTSTSAQPADGGLVATLDEPIDGYEALPSMSPEAAIQGLDEHLVAALAPASLAAEQYRALRTRLKRVEHGRVLRTIAITSPAKGDGKSLTAANLALTMAQEFQQRVLLVDADLRRPTVHRLFGIPEGPGLGEVLMNVAELDQALVPLPEHHLTVLPAGFPPSRPAELLGSATMRRVLDTLRTRFDRILIDVPPVAPLADLHILAPMVDGLLLIVRAGITPKPAIERALAGLDSSKVLGLVLNESGGEANDGSKYADYGYIG